MAAISEFRNPSIGGSQISCGVHLLWGFSKNNPEQELMYTFNWAAKNWPHKCAFYIFSDHNSVKTGDRDAVRDIPSPHHGLNLAAYIQEQGLGQITASAETTNPNSQNRIQTWIWMVDHAALTAWCHARGIRCYGIPAPTSAPVVAPQPSELGFEELVEDLQARA